MQLRHVTRNQKIRNYVETDSEFSLVLAVKLSSLFVALPDQLS